MSSTELFEAASQLDEKCVMVAIGPNEPDKDDGLDEDFITRAVEQGIRLPGMQTNVDEWYSAMDIFVLASHREGFPRAAMEAAAMGLPVIATGFLGAGNAGPFENLFRRKRIEDRFLRIAGRAMMITMSTVAITKPRLIGRVMNTDGSPREISSARLRFSSISGPSTKPSSMGAGWHSSLRTEFGG